MHTSELSITEAKVQAFEDYLFENERAVATIKKYTKNIRRLETYLNGEALTKQKLIQYREELLKTRRTQTVNGALSAINSFLKFMERGDCIVKLLRVQRKAFLEESRELTEAEYMRLLAAAKKSGKEQNYMLMMTLCGTGIRISELPYITVEGVEKKRVEIRLKGKSRVILLSGKLQKRLKEYIKKHKIESGSIFCTRTGRPLDRSNICHGFKKLCESAEVEPRKVFPHNFRHLFAKLFYEVEKNLAHLADVLGHSRIETTRIYVAVSAQAHTRILDRMKLVI